LNRGCADRTGWATHNLGEMTGRGSTRVAIITGAGSGIGAAVARRLSRDGWRLILTGRREPALRAVAEGLDALVIPGDVRLERHATELINAAMDVHGRLDGLVLNAGISLAGRVDNTSPEDWRAVIDTNLTGPFLLCRAALPALIETEGAIVAVGSIAATVAGPELAAYGAAKAGLVRLMRSIAVDHGAAGIRANAVNPGWVRSEMADAELSGFTGALGADLDAVYAVVTRHVPARRPGIPAEVAAAIVWLLSPDAAYVNGAVLTVDGGTSIVDVGTLVFASDTELSS
jgi:meso-butanediol dehydrogenase / (S,S)-butanediol dehydrogenase / diacetyl reductase